MFMAVREGFEPSVPKRYSDLAGQCIRPLCHLTKLTNIFNIGRLFLYNLPHVSYDIIFIIVLSRKNYNADLAVSTNFVNSAALFKAISARTFLSNSIPAFLRPLINTE